jgi:hypothetical protein
MLIWVIISDVATLLVSSSLLVRFAKLRHSHPAVIYLIFHVLVFTTRLISIYAGSPTLFSEWGFTSARSTDPVTHVEIARAMIIADVALLIMTGGWISASVRDQAKFGPLPKPRHEKPGKLSITVFKWVIAVALPIGIVGFLMLSRIPGVDTMEFTSALPRTGWIGITQTWLGLCLIALIYLYGFRWYYLLPLGFYLMIQMLQGFHRLRFILPVILLSMLFLDAKNKKWPSLRIVLVLAVVGALFTPMKKMGKMYQAGVPVGQIIEYTFENMGKDLDKNAFLDEYAAALTLLDQHGRWYFGREWFYTLTILWIPRPLWPDKPHMGGFIKEIATPTRPMGEMGMIVTFLGDAYAHFRYFGVILVPLFFSYWTGRFYFAAYRRRYHSITRFAYLLVCCNLIQIYRDGLIGFVFLIAVYMMPLFFIVVAHSLVPAKKTAMAYPAISKRGMPKPDNPRPRWKNVSGN